MEFLNKIGQRNIAKILFITSLVVGFVLFFIKNEMIFINSRQVWFGIMLLSLPNLLLMLTALKSKEFRFLSIVLSFNAIILNIILFLLKVPDILFLVTLVEILFSIVLFIIAIRGIGRGK